MKEIVRVYGMSTWADFFFVFLLDFETFFNESWRTIFLLGFELCFLAVLIGKLLANFGDLLLMVFKLFPQGSNLSRE